MASPIYVRSGATGANTGASWTDAYTSLATPLGSAPAAGTVIWVSEDHSETLNSATTLTAGASEAASTSILCVNHTSNSLASGAVVATAAGISLTLAGYAYCNGVGFSIGASNSTANIGFSSTVATEWTFENSTLKLNSTNTASGIYVGSIAFVPYRMVLINSTLSFGSASQTIHGKSTLFSGTMPTHLVAPLASNTAVTIEGVDLSTLLASNRYLLGSASAFSVAMLVKDCKLAVAPSLATLVDGGTIAATSVIDVIRCAVASTPGNGIRQRYAGEGAYVDSTAVTLTGGASQDGGSTVRSRLVSTTTSASVGKPFELSTITVWNTDTTAAMTVAFQGIWDNAAVPNDNDIWAEVEYLQDSSDPLGQFVSSNLSSALVSGISGNALAAGTGTWNGAGGMANPKPFMLVTPSFTPAQAGFLTIRLKVGKPSATLYIDPKPIITLASGTFPNISRSIDLPSGGMMHETGSITPGPVQMIPMIRPSFW